MELVLLSRLSVGAHCNPAVASHILPVAKEDTGYYTSEVTQTLPAVAWLGYRVHYK